MPIGLEALPLQVMGLGIDGMLAAARWVAELGGAEIRAPQLGAVSLLVTTGGFLWLTLWTERWRLAGIPVIAIGLLSAPLLHRPADLMITADAGAVAFRDTTGTLRIAGTREGSFVAEQILEKETDPPDAGDAGQGFACDATACATIGLNGLTLAYVTDALAFPEECRRADIMVTPLKAPPGCAAHLIIDRPALDQLGAQSIRAGAPDEFLITGEWSSVPRPWQRPLVRTPYPEP